MLLFLRSMTKILPSNIVFNNKCLVRSYKGGVPGCNLPFRKSMDSPMRLVAFYTLFGVIGFGAPWLVVMHQMLRPYDYDVD